MQPLMSEANALPLIYVIDEDSAHSEDLAYVIDSGNEAEWKDDIAYVIEQACLATSERRLARQSERARETIFVKQ
jgi:hypothetical protein